MKSILVIGMGRLGRHLATDMQELGNEVLVVDNNEKVIDELSSVFPDAIIGDCSNEAVLRSLGINNFDICFVTLAENFQASLEITSLLKELGAKMVVSRAKRDIQAKFLLHNGADEVIYPERETAKNLAIRHSADNIFEYIDLTPEIGIFEILVPKEWTGKTVAAINVRHKYHINILTVKNDNKIKPLPGAEHIFLAGDHIMVMGKNEDVFKVANDDL